ncbi:cytochrome b/b6 domain-containing protein [Rhodoferax sp. PAMC 29310]|uniref:cytochrome b/b6 domain-containing protein n=1 Tax=Rhodoferax sp. PAMC 29310 TaxID=2822760 RepID=UPI001B33B5D0|nr:cytochrome b/b6 domain-containing protein [Rhodoferax sp. PAMC 29310]
MSSKVRVWDLPSRIFHWLLASSVIGLVVTANVGGAAMEWHFRLGYTVLSLLLFRLVWGLVGGRWSRFSSFLYSPATLWRYMTGRGRPEHSIGHNPMGALSVYAMLVFLLLQVGAGLFSDDEISAYGPLGKFVSNETVVSATFYHTNVGKFILLALIAIHLIAIVYYVFKKKNNLVRPMLSGDKATDVLVPPSRDDGASRLLALAIYAMCASLVAAMVKLAS